MLEILKKFLAENAKEISDIKKKIWRLKYPLQVISEGISVRNPKGVSEENFSRNFIEILRSAVEIPLKFLWGS